MHLFLCCNFNQYTIFLRLDCSYIRIKLFEIQKEELRTIRVGSSLWSVNCSCFSFQVNWPKHSTLSRYCRCCSAHQKAERSGLHRPPWPSPGCLRNSSGFPLSDLPGSRHSLLLSELSCGISLVLCTTPHILL